MGLRRSALIGIAAFLLALGTSATAAAHPTADGVSAVLLDSDYGCDIANAWQTLNSTWSDYGSVPVSITTSGHLCSGKFTLSDLEASGADTVILDMSATIWTLTPRELQALQTYVEEGHTLLGEATIFQWKNQPGNNGLAPLFGLAEQPIWYVGNLSGNNLSYRLKEHDPDASVLLRDVPNPYISSRAGRGQLPADKTWDSTTLDGARYIGQTKQGHTAISVYDAPAYTAIYIASEAAFESLPDDLQFLYNAIIYPNEG